MKASAQTGPIGAITPLTAGNRESVIITLETQLSGCKRVLKRLAADLQAHDRQSTTTAGLTSIPFETEITTHLPPQLDGLLHGEQPLQAVQANPLQTRRQLKFRTVPVSPPFQRHRASIRKTHLKGTIGPFLIETKARSSRQRKLKVRWLNTDFGWIDKPNTKVHAMQKLTVWLWSWHPKLPLLIAA